MKRVTLICWAMVSIFMLLSCSAGERDTIVELNTSKGVITLKLYNDTPLHKANFEKMVTEGVYDGMLFHRVIDNFMIQTGDPTSKGALPGAELGEESAGEEFANEISESHFHVKGVLAAAREGNDVNPERQSSGSHFYLAKGRVFTHEELDELVERISTRRSFEAQMIMNPDFRAVPFTLSEEQIEAYTTVGGIPHLDGEYTVFGEIVEGLDVLEAIITVATDQNDRPLDDVTIYKAMIK